MSNPKNKAVIGAFNDNLPCAIAQNLSRLLADDGADVFPAAKEISYEYSIGIEVIRLDGKLGDQVTLTLIGRSS